MHGYSSGCLCYCTCPESELSIETGVDHVENYGRLCNSAIHGGKKVQQYFAKCYI